MIVLSSIYDLLTPGFDAPSGINISVKINQSNLSESNMLKHQTTLSSYCTIEYFRNTFAKSFRSTPLHTRRQRDATFMADDLLVGLGIIWRSPRTYCLFYSSFINGMESSVPHAHVYQSFQEFDEIAPSFLLYVLHFHVTNSVHVTLPMQLVVHRVWHVWLFYFHFIGRCGFFGTHASYLASSFSNY